MSLSKVSAICGVPMNSRSVFVWSESDFSSDRCVLFVSGFTAAKSIVKIFAAFFLFQNKNVCRQIIGGC